MSSYQLSDFLSSMNLKLGNRLVEIAKAMKPKYESGKSFHISALLRKNKISCLGWNNYNKHHLAHRFGAYRNYKGFTENYRPSIHSESSVAVKMGLDDLSDYTLVNIRINNNNQVALSAPCPNCFEQIILGLGIKKVFYSTNEGLFEQLHY